MAPLFTVLLPIHRPPVFLPLAIETVLSQTIPDFELFIVCDGPPAETIACAEQYARQDSRIRVFPFAKDAREGERYRHAALAVASGTYVAAIDDDDLWFPNHLETLQGLLQEVDFGHVLNTHVDQLGNICTVPSDLALPEFRQKMLDRKFNRFGQTVCGYRLASYRKLPEGWAPTPPNFWPDLHMWRKFLRMKEFTFGTRMAITALALPFHLREGVSIEARAQECRAWRERIADPREREAIIQAGWRSLVRSALPNDSLAHAAWEATEQRNDMACALAAMAEARDALEREARELRAQRGRITGPMGTVSTQIRGLLKTLRGT